MKKFLSLLFALLALSFVFVSCGDKDAVEEAEDKNSIVGTWKSTDDDFTIIYNEDGTGKTDEEEFTWSVDGNTVTMTVVDPQTGEKEIQDFPFTIEGDKLSITERGKTLTFTRQ